MSTPFDLREFTYAHDGLALKGQLAVPDGPGPHPAVLVMHSALGLGELVCQRALDLAAMGYVALATDMYGLGRREPDFEAHTAQHHALQADHPRLRARVAASFEAVRALPDVDPRRIGAIGYCFGGQCVLELARSGAQVAAVVSFHGLLKTQAPARAGATGAKILAITGAHDPYAPAEDVDAFQKEMAAAGADWQLTVYGQGWHSFTDPEIDAKFDIPGVRYDRVLDRLSWDQAVAFLDAALGGG